MNELQAFFAENVENDIVEEVVISKRFKDKNGKPIPWKIKAIGEDVNTELRKSCTKKVKIKNGIFMNETDQEAYLAKLAVECVVFPDLRNAELLKSYGVMAPEELVKKMLLPGEYGKLLEKIQELNGFDLEASVEEIKN
jgi:hypothetical protein